MNEADAVQSSNLATLPHNTYGHFDPESTACDDTCTYTLSLFVCMQALRNMLQLR